MSPKRPVRKTPLEPQTVVRLNPEQREIVAKLQSLEDASISDVMKRGLKMLCEKHKLEWPPTHGVKD